LNKNYLVKKAFYGFQIVFAGNIDKIFPEMVALQGYRISGNGQVEQGNSIIRFKVVDMSAKLVMSYVRWAGDCFDEILLSRTTLHNKGG